MTYGGRSLARHDGKVYFVEGGVPGDQLRCVVTREKKNWGEADLESMISPSRERRDAPCPYADSCGGCQWQALHYQQQIDWKKDFIVSAFKKLAGVELKLDSFLASDRELNYRNRIQLRLQIVNQSLQLGYYQKQSHSIVVIDRCAVASLAINQAIAKLSNLRLPAGIALEDSRIELQELNDAVILAKLTEGRRDSAAQLSQLAAALRKLVPELLQTTEFVAYDHHQGLTYFTQAGLFQQINQNLNHALRDLITQESAGAKRVLDLYCGSGNLSLHLRHPERTIRGVELSAAAIAAADYTEQRNPAPGDCHYLALDSAEFLRRDAAAFAADLIICDPPRAGLTESVQFVGELAAKKIIYVACDPNSLAKDCSILAGYGYRVTKLFGFDFFPQTYHVESVAILEAAP